MPPSDPRQPDDDRPDDASDGRQSVGKQQLAADRTDLAEDRTMLANERTHASWLRSGLACVAVGLGFRWLLREFEPVWLAQSVATAFVVAGIAILGFSLQRALRVSRRLNQHQVDMMDRRKTAVISLLLMAASAAVVVMLWVVR